MNSTNWESESGLNIHRLWGAINDIVLVLTTLAPQNKVFNYETIKIKITIEVKE